MTEKKHSLMSQIHNRLVTNNTTPNDLVILYERTISGDFIPEYIEKDLENPVVPSTSPDQQKSWIKVLDKIGLGKVDNKLSRRSNTADMIIKKKKSDEKNGSSSSITPRVKTI
jgi:hypothetical protein